MTLGNPKPWIECAQQNGFAISAFNANTLEQVRPLCRPRKLNTHLLSSR